MNITNIQPKTVFHFEVSSRNYSLIINALKKSGGNGIQLASELESKRVQHWKEIVKKFQTLIQTNEGKLSEEEKNEQT